LSKDFYDCNFGYKFSGGAHAFSFMQVITDNFIAGFEALYHPHEKRLIYNIGAKYVKDNHTMTFAYLPL